MAIENLPDYRTRLEAGAVAPLPSLDRLDLVSKRIASGGRYAITHAYCVLNENCQQVPERVAGAMLVFSGLSVAPIIEDPTYREQHPAHSLHQGLSRELIKLGHRASWSGYVFEAPADRYLFLISDRWPMQEQRQNAIADLTAPDAVLFDHTIVIGESAVDALVFEHGNAKTGFNSESYL